MFAREIYNIDSAISALNTNPTQAGLYQIRDLIRASRVSLQDARPSDSRLLKAIELLNLAEAQMSSRVNPAVDFFKTAAQAPISPFTSTPRGPWGLQSLESIEAGPPQPLQTQARQQFTDVQNLLIQAKSLILSADTPPVRSNPSALGYCNTEQVSEGVDIGYREGEPLVNLMCEAFIPEQFYEVGILRPESFMDALKLFYPSEEIVANFQPVFLADGGVGTDGLAEKPKLPKEAPPKGVYSALYGDIKMFTGWFFIFEAMLLGKELELLKMDDLRLDPDYSKAYTLFSAVAAAGATYAITGDPAATASAAAPAADVFFDPPEAAIAKAGVQAGANVYSKYKARQQNKTTELAQAEQAKKVGALTPIAERNDSQEYTRNVPSLGAIDRLVAGGVALGAVGAMAFTKYALDNPKLSALHGFRKKAETERGIEMGFRFLIEHSQLVYWKLAFADLAPALSGDPMGLKRIIDEPSVEHGPLQARYGGLSWTDNARAFEWRSTKNNFLFYDDNYHFRKAVRWLAKHLNRFKYQDLVVRTTNHEVKHEDVAFFKTSPWNSYLTWGASNGVCAELEYQATTIPDTSCDSFLGCVVTGVSYAIDVMNPYTYGAKWDGLNCGEGMDVYDPEHHHSNGGVAHFQMVYNVDASIKPFSAPPALALAPDEEVVRTEKGRLLTAKKGSDWTRTPDGDWMPVSAARDSARIPLGMAQALMAVFLIYGADPAILERFNLLGADWTDKMCRHMDLFYSTPEFLARKEQAFKAAQAYLDKRPPKFVDLPVTKPSPSKFLPALVLGAAIYGTYKLATRKK